MIELNKICRDVFIADNNTKVDKMVELLDKYEVPYSELGPGTNRFAIMIDGYVFKIAMDTDGIRDNLAEFSMAMELQPFVTKVYECNGLLMVAEYVTVISKDEFQRSKEEIRQILTHISQGYLLGDVGTINKNFMNWGYRPDGSLVILDFAYIYRVVGDEMLCNNILDDEKPCGTLLEYDDNYNNLICPRCRKKYTFHEIRRRISRSYEENELNAIKTIAIKMTEPTLNTDTHHEEIINNGGEDTMKNKNYYGEYITEEEAVDSYQDALEFIRMSNMKSGTQPKENERSIPKNRFLETDQYCYEMADDDPDDFESTREFLSELAKRDKCDEDEEWVEDPDDAEYDSEECEYDEDIIEESTTENVTDEPTITITDNVEMADIVSSPKNINCTIDINDAEEERNTEDGEPVNDEYCESDTDEVGESNTEPEELTDSEAEDIREEIIDEIEEDMSTCESGSVIVYEPDEENPESNECESEDTSDSQFKNDDVLILSNTSDDSIKQMREELVSSIVVEDADECYDEEYDDLYEDNYRKNQAYRNGQRNKRNNGGE